MSKTLREQAEKGKVTLQQIDEELYNFLTYFRGAKFSGENDYVRTHEIISRLEQLRELTIGALEEIDLPTFIRKPIGELNSGEKFRLLPDEKKDVYEVNFRWTSRPGMVNACKEKNKEETLNFADIEVVYIQR